MFFMEYSVFRIHRSLFFIEVFIFRFHRSIPTMDQSINFIGGSSPKLRRSCFSILASLRRIHRRQANRQDSILS